MGKIRPSGPANEGHSIDRSAGMATLEEIAAAAGVSRSTVSRVINHEPRVSDETRQRVWGVIRQFDFQPNTAARALAGNRSYMVGLVIQRPLDTVGADLYFSRLMHSVAAACEEHGYHLMLSLMPSQTTEAYSRIIRGGRLDGLLVYYSCVKNPFVERLHEERLPFVLMGRHLTRTDIPSVDADNVHGATLAAQHLASLGYRHIATITGPLHAVSSIDRREGFLAGLRSFGLRCLPQHIVEGDFTELSGYHGMRQLLQTQPRPQAVFAANDVMAAGALRALRDAGLRAPQDIAIVGFDDMPLAETLNPALTTVRQSASDMGQTAVDTLIAQIEQEPKRARRQRANGQSADDSANRRRYVGHRIILPVELVVRQSCGATGRVAERLAA